MTSDQLSVLVSVLTVLLGGGGLAAFAAWRKQVKQEPIDEETAAVINARTAGELALALARQQGEDMKTMRIDLDAARTELATLRQLVPWVRNLHVNWDAYRVHETPPGGLPPGVI